MTEEIYFCALLDSCEDDKTYVKVVETAIKELFVKFCLYDNNSKSEKYIKITPLEFLWVAKSIKNEKKDILEGRFQFQNIHKLKEDTVYRSIVVDLNASNRMEIEVFKYKNSVSDSSRIRFYLDEECKINLLKNISNITKVLFCKKIFN